MISLTYECGVCDFSTFSLNDAQEHCNASLHTVDVRGTITSNASKVVTQQFVNEQLRRETRDQMIMRRAKQKGLVKK